MTIRLGKGGGGKAKPLRSCQTQPLGPPSVGPSPVASPASLSRASVVAWQPPALPRRGA